MEDYEIKELERLMLIANFETFLDIATKEEIFKINNEINVIIDEDLIIKGE